MYILIYQSYQCPLQMSYFYDSSLQLLDDEERWSNYPACKFLLIQIEAFVDILPLTFHLWMYTSIGLC